MVHTLVAHIGLSNFMQESVMEELRAGALAGEVSMTRWLLSLLDS